MSRARKKKKWRWWILGLLLLVGLLAGDYYLYPLWSQPEGRSFNQGENGLWLRYTWVFGERSEKDMREMAQRLRDQQIRYAYFHLRDVTGEGKLRFHRPETTRRLVDFVHRQAPGVQVIAWIYVGNPRGHGAVNLADVRVRRNMVAEAVGLVKTCGFDGIQWDYEICPDGDPDFLSLMRETRQALPPGKILSIATPIWLPRPLLRWGWSDDYFAQVAATCDQVAVMCYDTGFWMPRSYVWIVHQQAVHATQAVARGNPRCRVLLGVPTYGKGFFSHNPHAENIRMALKGVREGLADPRADRSVFAGIAPFADYTTQPDDWRTYQTYWLKP